MKTVFMYAGQGSQFYHMGESFYNEDGEYRKYADEFDDIVFAKKGFRLKDIVFDAERKKSDEFTDLLESNLAIIWFEYAATKMLMARGICPDYLVGSSLGELTCAVVSGALKVDAMIEAVIKLSLFIQQKVEKGGMVAIFDQASLFDEMKNIFGKCEIVSINHNKHFVVSGGEKDIAQLCDSLEQRGILFKKLTVHFPFHTALMDVIKEEVLESFQTLPISAPKYTIYSCADKGPLKWMDKDYFWRVSREMINFHQCIDLLEREKCIYVDLSANGELAGVVRTVIEDKTKAHLLSSAFINKPNVEKLVSDLKAKVGVAYKAYVFPGQGSQKVGMGADVFKAFPELVQKADKILGYSIEELCLRDPKGLLGQTAYTQPALYVVCSLSYLKAMKDGKKKPSYMAGHSIGEYAALFAAGVFDFETGLRIVQRRGQLMSQVGGGMAAILGLSEEQIREAIEKNNLSTLDIANLNTPNQIIIAGPKEDIIKAKEIISQVEGFKRYVVLEVSGAFHSRYMGEIREEYEQFLREFTFNEPMIKVVSNLTARPHTKERIIEKLGKHLVSPVRWCESIRYILGKNAVDVEQIGPGDVAIGLVATIKRRTKPLIVNDEEESIQPKEEMGKQQTTTLEANELGSKEFKKAYHTSYPIYLGGMYQAISGEELVIKACNAGLLAFYGSGGCTIDEISKAIIHIQKEVRSDTKFGVNIPADMRHPEMTDQIITLLLNEKVTVIEAAAFIEPTLALVKYRAKGLFEEQGKIKSKNRLIIKLSRPEIARSFLMPASEELLNELVEKGEITEKEASYAKSVPVATQVCVEADSGGHTDRSNLFITLPTIRRIAAKANEHYEEPIQIGAAGGISTPETVAAAFLMGADFIVTGSINQCTVEAGTSETAKAMLEKVDIQDTEYIPVIDAPESSSKVQVVKKGSLFPMRANRLYELSKMYKSFEEMDQATIDRIETTILKEKIPHIVEQLETRYGRNYVNQLDPKQKMDRVIKWYFHMSNEWAIRGNEKQKANYQIPCGPAMGAFNKWVEGSKYQAWHERHVDEINLMLLESAKKYVTNDLKGIE